MTCVHYANCASALTFHLQFSDILNVDFGSMPTNSPRCDTLCEAAAHNIVE